MFTYELELPCQLHSIEVFDQTAKELLEKFTNSHHRLGFIVHELLINSLEATRQKYDEEASNYSIKLKITSQQEAVEISVIDQAGGMRLEQIQNLDATCLEDLLYSECGRGLLMIKSMVDDMGMYYDRHGLFEVKVRKEGVL
ncbi:ATP-binding protein [Bacillus sp. AK128]